MNVTSTERNASIGMIAAINKVEGFDPSAFAVEYLDLNSGETRKRLPVMAQMAWFRLRYPDGKISVTATLVKDFYIAHARVYHHYNDSADSFLAEATASRKFDPEKPSVSPREWAQTAAIGIALRNAGFGLQFHAAGDAFDQLAVDELDVGGVPCDETVSQKSETPSSVKSKNDSQQTYLDTTFDATRQTLSEVTQEQEDYPTEYPTEPSPQESPLEKAMKLPCPITKDGLRGKTLGELVRLDPGALIWIANKYKKDPAIAEGARLICEHSLSA